MVREQAHVPRPLAEGRQRDRDHVDAVEEIVTKLALPDELGRVAIRRGHETDVHVEELGSPDATDLPFLEGPEELGLERLGQLPDLVEKEGAPVRDLDHPGLGPIRTGERAALVTEQLGLEQRIGQCGAVDGNEHLGGPGALRVDRPGDQLLPGAGFSLDQDVGVGPGGLPDEVEHRLHGRALADHVVEARARRERLPQPAILLDEPAPFGRALDGQTEHVVGRQRLQQVIERPRPHGLDRGLDASVSGDHDHDDVGIELDGRGSGRASHRPEAS